MISYFVPLFPFRISSWNCNGKTFFMLAVMISYFAVVLRIANWNVDLKKCWDCITMLYRSCLAKPVPCQYDKTNTVHCCAHRSEHRDERLMYCIKVTLSRVTVIHPAHFAHSRISIRPVATQGHVIRALHPTWLVNPSPSEQPARTRGVDRGQVSIALLGPATGVAVTTTVYANVGLLITVQRVVSAGPPRPPACLLSWLAAAAAQGFIHLSVAAHSQQPGCASATVIGQWRRWSFKARPLAADQRTNAPPGRSAGCWVCWVCCCGGRVCKRRAACVLIHRPLPTRSIITHADGRTRTCPVTNRLSRRDIGQMSIIDWPTRTAVLWPDWTVIFDRLTERGRPSAATLAATSPSHSAVGRGRHRRQKDWPALAGCDPHGLGGAPHNSLLDITLRMFGLAIGKVRLGRLATSSRASSHPWSLVVTPDP